MNNINLYINAALLLLLLCAVYFTSFKNQVPTCDLYIFNVYIYVILAIVGCIFVIQLINKFNLPITFTKSLIALAVAIIILMIMGYISPEQILLNHLLWILFIICTGFIFYSTVRYSQLSSTLVSAAFGTITIMTIIAIAVLFNPTLATLDWGTGIFIALVALLFAWLVPIILGLQSTILTKVLAFITIVVFCFITIYDNARLIKLAEMCTFPNYPQTSLNLFLDFANIFSSSVILNN